MGIKVITMVGTSIFTNYMKKEVVESFKSAQKNYQAIDSSFKGLGDVEAEKYEEQAYKSYIAHLERIVPQYWLKGWE